MHKVVVEHSPFQQFTRTHTSKYIQIQQKFTSHYDFEVPYIDENRQVHVLVCHYSRILVHNKSAAQKQSAWIRLSFELYVD